MKRADFMTEDDAGMTTKYIYINGKQFQATPTAYDGKTFAFNNSQVPVLVQQSSKMPTEWQELTPKLLWDSEYYNKSRQKCLLTIMINGEPYMLFAGLGPQDSRLAIDYDHIGAVKPEYTNLGGVNSPAQLPLFIYCLESEAVA